MATTKTKKFNIKFGPFDRSGHAVDEHEAPIEIEGVYFGAIVQCCDYQTQCSYAQDIKTVRGYTIDGFSAHLVGDASDPDDATRCREFKTLKLARDYIRDALKTNAAVIAEVKEALVQRRAQKQREALRAGLQLVLNPATTEMPADVREALGSVLGRLVRFETSDGYYFDFDGQSWSDGDMTFAGDHTGPLDHNGQRVPGRLHNTNRIIGI